MNNKASDIVLHLVLVNNVVSTNTNTLTGIVYTLFSLSFLYLFIHSVQLVNTYTTLVNTFILIVITSNILVNTYFISFIKSSALLNTFTKYTLTFTIKVITIYTLVNTLYIYTKADINKVFTNMVTVNTYIYNPITYFLKRPVSESMFTYYFPYSIHLNLEINNDDY